MCVCVCVCVLVMETERVGRALVDGIISVLGELFIDLAEWLL